MKPILLVFACVSLFFSGMAQEAPNVFDSTIFVSGKILNISKNSSDKCLVELSDESGVISSKYLPGGKHSFDFELRKNANYTIRITKEGYLPKVLTVNTVLPKNASGVFDFAFNVQLLSVDQGQYISPEVLNRPVALIRYDLLAESFVYDLSFATLMKMKSYSQLSVKVPVLLTLND